MKTICITTTRNEPDGLQRSLAYFERSVVKEETEWWIFDSNVEPKNPDPYACRYIHLPNVPLTPLVIDKYIQEAKPDHLVFWREGDWYHPHRIQFQVDHLKVDCHLHGWVDSLSYHIPDRKWMQAENTRYSTLAETAMTLSMWDRLITVYSAVSSSPWRIGQTSELILPNMGMFFWSMFPNNQFLGPNPGLALCIESSEFPRRSFYDLSNILMRIVGEEDADEIRKAYKRKP